MSLVIPKSPTFTVKSSATMQLRAAKSLCTNFFVDRYAIPSAISIAICRILSNFGGAFDMFSHGLWLLRYLFRSPFTINSMMTNVGWPRVTTPRSFTT